MEEGCGETSSHNFFFRGGDSFLRYLFFAEMQSYTYFVQSKFALTDEDPHFLINVPHTHIPDVIILCEFHKVSAAPAH